MDGRALLVCCLLCLVGLAALSDVLSVVTPALSDTPLVEPPASFGVLLLAAARVLVTSRCDRCREERVCCCGTMPVSSDKAGVAHSSVSVDETSMVTISNCIVAPLHLTLHHDCSTPKQNDTNTTRTPLTCTMWA